ncbi:type VI secretion system-associated protein VasI [Celerinatantimonas sp. YJH-8]|uniref:type VI secretion system-associated protein VasI n=1 Tax=Celerinatantimonas sp. YJH-8 TaxID=3228714 RepID=UPI0038C618CD
MQLKYAASGWLLITLGGLLGYPLQTRAAGPETLAPSEQVVSAKRCTQIPERLKRLQCFDHIFATPVRPSQSAAVSQDVPLIWQRAVDSEQQAAASSGFHLSMLNSSRPEQGIWLTTTARHTPSQHATTPASPILMLSCMDKISRVALILPQPIAPGRVSISVLGTTTDTQRWLNDDSGLVLEAGRGLLAIRLMKVMTHSSSLLLRSNQPQIDGLTFDTQGLNDSIQVLRQACDW